MEASNKSADAWRGLLIQQESIYAEHLSWSNRIVCLPLSCTEAVIESNGRRVAA